MLSWGLVVRATCSPVVRCGWILVVWALLWVWMLVGAAIFQAIENPTRREPEATAFLQGELTYSEGAPPPPPPRPSHAHSLTRRDTTL
jgi:hypothetical protein